VGVEDRLPGLEAGVEDNAVPTAANPLGLGNLVRLGHDLGQQPVLGARERGKIGIVIFGDDQHMGGGLRVDIAERDGPGGLGDSRRWDFPRNDLAEKAVCHGVILAC
jgi:hypothetical protein